MSQGASFTGPRFLKLTDMADVLGVSSAQTYALVRSGEVPTIKVGGRGQWRVEALVLENAIRKIATDTAQFVHDHPLGANGSPDGAGDAETD